MSAERVDQAAVGRVPRKDVVAATEVRREPITLFSLTRDAQHVDITGGTTVEQQGAFAGVVYDRARGGPRGKVLIIDLGNTGVPRLVHAFADDDSKFSIVQDSSHGEILDLVPADKRAGVLANAMGGSENEKIQRRGLLAKIQGIFQQYPGATEEHLSAVERFAQAVKHLRRDETRGLTREQKEHLKTVIKDDERTSSVATTLLLDLDSWFEALADGVSVGASVDDLWQFPVSIAPLLFFNVNHPNSAAGRLLSTSMESFLGGEYGTVAVVGAEWLPFEEAARLRDQAARLRTQTVFLYGSGKSWPEELYEGLSSDTHVLLSESNGGRARKMAEFAVGLTPVVVGNWSVNAGSTDGTTFTDGSSDHFQLTPHPVASGDSRAAVENRAVTGGVTASEQIDLRGFRIHPDSLQHLLNMAIVTRRRQRDFHVVPLFPGMDDVPERGLAVPPQLLRPQEVLAQLTEAQDSVVAAHAANTQRVVDGKAPKPELTPGQRAQEFQMRCATQGISRRNMVGAAMAENMDRIDPEAFAILQRLVKR